MTAKTRAALKTQADTDVASNGVGGITGTILNTLWNDLLDSVLLFKTSSVLEVGHTATPHDLETVSSGTTTPDPASGNYQDLTNGGAFTLAAPTAAGSYAITLDITNNASAGAITLSGFPTAAISGDDFDTTNGNAFRCYITKGTAGASIHVEAMQ